jgi:tetratricopeptide (TPR) repeat protein
MEKVANKNKLDGNFYEAAKNFEKCDKVYLKDAADCYNRSGDIQDSLRCYDAHIDYLCENGKFYQAGKSACEAAKVVNKDDEKYIEYNRKAAKFFELYDSNSSSKNQCRREMADCYYKLQRYSEARELYESIGFDFMKNSLLKYGAPELFIQACKCRVLLNDLDNLLKDIERYENVYPGCIPESIKSM